MIRIKIMRLSMLLAVIAFSVLRGYGTAVIYAVPAEEKAPLIKGITLLESKGIIEPVVEIGNGGSFQQNFQKVKKFGGTLLSFNGKAKNAVSFRENNRTCFSGFLSVPRYLFNRSILI